MLPVLIKPMNNDQNAPEITKGLPRGLSTELGKAITTGHTAESKTIHDKHARKTTKIKPSSTIPLILLFL